MKSFSSILKTAVLIPFILLISITASGQKINVMTYNIRYDNPGDGANNWDNRKKDVVKLIRKYTPVIFSIQEGLQNQVTYIDSCFKNYTYIGVGRTDGYQKGEYSAIFYDTTLYSVLDHSTFWLSKTSDTVSIGWDAVLERICTYGLFMQKETGKQFWVFNTHFDHIGESARKHSAKLIINKIIDLNNQDLPLVLTGDLNAEPGSRAIKILEKYLQRADLISEAKPQGPSATFTGFESGTLPEKHIDYIFVSNFLVLNYAHITDKRKDDLFISDHLPVLAEVRFYNDSDESHEK